MAIFSDIAEKKCVKDSRRRSTAKSRLVQRWAAILAIAELLLTLK